ncbi:hypothetical protein QMN62_26280, partial [Escherichia coli]|nr:hypothetical protein [Escherichia coli]
LRRQRQMCIRDRYLTGLGTVNDRMLILVDIEKLLTSDEMALIDSMAE